VTVAAATVAVVTATLVAITSQPDPNADPLGTVMAQIAVGKSGYKLMQERQEVILQDAATQSFSVTSVPKISTVPPPGSSGPSGGAPIVPDAPPPDPTSAKGIAYSLLSAYGFSTDQWGCLDDLWTEESNWQYNAENASGAYGIPQALPGSKMASAGPDWQTDPTTQIKWGLGYIQSIYGTPCNAWAHEQAYGWY
jgi:hypothetical protein